MSRRDRGPRRASFARWGGGCRRYRGGLLGRISTRLIIVRESDLSKSMTTSATEGGKLAPKYAVCVCQAVGSGQSHHTASAVYATSARAISEAGGGEGYRSGRELNVEALAAIRALVQAGEVSCS